MFKTTYTAMCESIAPTEAVCRQVLAAMQAEEAKQMPTIVPVKKAQSHRQIWTLAACAAVVLVAVTLTMTLMKDDKPPVLPAGVTTTVTETTTTVTTTTTVEGEIIPPPPTDTSVPTQSTTEAPAVKPPTAPDQSGTTASTTVVSTTTTRTTTTTTSTATTISTLPPVGDYDELFQWIDQFTTTAPSKSETFPPQTTTNPPTDGWPENDNTPTASPTTDQPMYSSTAPTTTTDVSGVPSESIKTTQCPTTIVKAPTTTKLAPMSTTTAYLPVAEPTQPFGGVVSYEEKTTSNTSQQGDRVIGRLQNNAVLLAPLDSAETICLSTTKPPLGKGMVVKEFCLYGDRMAIICGLEHTENTEVTRVFVYDISDPTAPRLLRDFGQDGYFLAAHRVDGVLYLASYYVPQDPIRSDKPNTFIPHLYRQGAASLLLPSQIAPAKHPVCNGYTVLTAISLDDDPTLTSAAALYGQTNSYFSVCNASILITSKPYEVTPGSNEYVTDVVQVTLEGGHVYLAAFATL